MCHNSQVKLDLFCLSVCHRLSILCTAYCSKECQCDANRYYRPLKKQFSPDSKSCHENHGFRMMALHQLMNPFDLGHNLFSELSLQRYLIICFQSLNDNQFFKFLQLVVCLQVLVYIVFKHLLVCHCVLVAGLRCLVAFFNQT